jgi:hypothetical protein
MVNAANSNVARSSRNMQKIAFIRVIARWHTPCQKDSERNGSIEKGVSRENEKGFDSNILFVGFDVLVASRSGANTISQVRQLKTLRATHG